MSNEFEKIPVAAVKEFWDRRPCNLQHSLAPVGTKDYFDQVEQRKYFVEPHIPVFADFPRWAGQRVLEVGCGLGTDTINFARSGARVTAVDVSSESLRLARSRADLYGLQDRVTFCEGNCEELSRFVPVSRFDLVYSFGVIHHTPRPWRAIEQIRQYMDENSELRLMVYSRISYKLFWILHREATWDMSRIDELVARHSEAQTGCPVTYTYSENELRRLLDGFEILELRKAHVFTWDVDAYARHEYRRDSAWANVSAEQLAELEKELGWHTLVRARLKTA